MKCHLDRKALFSLLAIALSVIVATGTASADVAKYARFASNTGTAYGIVKGDKIEELTHAPFVGGKPTGRIFEIDKVRLLPPTSPSKVIAVGMNYRSHGGSRGGKPGLFAKLPSSLAAHGAAITYPENASNLHYEGELVVIIGKLAQGVTAAQAPAHIFAVTAGNDISERNWQFSDLQWIRAKASDGFGPVGPVMVAGLDYNDLRITTRLNGEVRQSESTKNLIHSIAELVSDISRYITLLPGDMIFTGTPGATAAMQPGDVVEIEIEGVGILRNQIVPAK